MVWARIDDAILDNPKVVRAGVIGFALHVAAITWCCRNLTDGFVPAGRISCLLDLSRYGMSAHDKNEDPILPSVDAHDVADWLVECGLWREVPGGYDLNDFLDYNPSRSDVQSKRAREVERKRSHRGAESGSGPAGILSSPDPDPLSPTLLDSDRKIVTGSPSAREATTAWSLDSMLSDTWRATAVSVIDPSGERVDIDDQWSRYLSDRLRPESLRAPSQADWRGWVLKAIGFAKRERQRESDRRAAALARRDPPPPPRETPEQARQFARELMSRVKSAGGAK